MLSNAGITTLTIEGDDYLSIIEEGEIVKTLEKSTCTLKYEADRHDELSISDNFPLLLIKWNDGIEAFAGYVRDTGENYDETRKTFELWADDPRARYEKVYITADFSDGSVTIKEAVETMVALMGAEHVLESCTDDTTRCNLCFERQPLSKSLRAIISLSANQLHWDCHYDFATSKFHHVIKQAFTTNIGTIGNSQEVIKGQGPFRKLKSEMHNVIIIKAKGLEQYKPFIEWVDFESYQDDFSVKTSRDYPNRDGVPLSQKPEAHLKTFLVLGTPTTDYGEAMFHSSQYEMQVKNLEEQQDKNLGVDIKKILATVDKYLVPSAGSLGKTYSTTYKHIMGLTPSTKAGFIQSSDFTQGVVNIISGLIDPDFEILYEASPQSTDESLKAGIMWLWTKRYLKDNLTKLNELMRAAWSADDFRGYLISYTYSKDTIKEIRDEASIALYGERPLEITSITFQSEQDLENYAIVKLASESELRRGGEFEFIFYEGSDKVCPVTPKPGDLIDAQIEDFDLEEDARVNSIVYTITSEGATDCKVSCLKIPSRGYLEALATRLENLMSYAKNQGISGDAISSTVKPEDSLDIETQTPSTSDIQGVMAWKSSKRLRQIVLQTP